MGEKFSKFKKNSMFGKIKTKEDALKVIKESSNGFFILAGIQAVLGYFVVGFSALIDAGIYALLAFFLKRFKSRVSAVILLIVSLLSLFVTFINKVENAQGGRNTLLAIMVVFVAFRSIQATFKYYKLNN